MSIPVFREPDDHEIIVKAEGYKLLKFRAKMPTITHVNSIVRLQLATRLGIGENYIYTESFETILGLHLLDTYITNYPPEMIKIFNSLPEGQRQNWEFFPDSRFTESVVAAFIDKLVETENGKKKYQPLDSIREQPEPIRLVSNPTPENLSESMDEPRGSGTTPNTSTSTDRGTSQPPNPTETNSPRESKKVRHRVEPN